MYTILFTIREEKLRQYTNGGQANHNEGFFLMKEDFLMVNYYLYKHK